MNKRMIVFILSILSATFSVNHFSFAAEPVAEASEFYEFDTIEQENVFQKLGKELRCPKCQNNNIADSNSSLAQDLRTKVYQMLKQGKSEDEIVEYMVDRYGNFVTYDPPLTPSTLILWVGPLSFLAIGFVVLYVRSRKPQAQKTETMLDDEEKARLAELLAEQPNQSTVDKDNKA